MSVGLDPGRQKERHEMPDFSVIARAQFTKNGAAYAANLSRGGDVEIFGLTPSGWVYVGSAHAMLTATQSVPRCPNPDWDCDNGVDDRGAR